MAKLPFHRNVKSKRWPEGAVVYQIYPRSFYDSNEDGIGDIPGITDKIPYLKDLGVDALWLSPFYPSPMADFGYDVADYCGVDPIFGTLQDMKTLIRTAHHKGIRIMVDLVPNHSSDEHEWFRQSRQSRENHYSDWYIWKDPKGFDKKGKPIPPNNWLNIFTGTTAWEWEPARQQFYLHSFDVRQPDLNWSNPAVCEAMKQIMRFWLDLGVDGFRVDAVRFMGKDPLFKDNAKNPHFTSKGANQYGSLVHDRSQGWPQLYSYLNDMADVLKEPKYRKSLRFMVTESYPEEPIEEYLAYYQGVDPLVAAPFNFEGLSLPWRAEPWRKFLHEFHTTLDAFSPLCVPSYAFGNHDQHRLATRLGDAGARSAAVLLLSLPGMAFIYNGEEIGMQNGKIPKKLEQDPAAKGGSGRDPERTPMQWDDRMHAGFSQAQQTWLPVHADYHERNVEAQYADPHSFLRLYRTLIRLRHKLPALRYGSIHPLQLKNHDVLAFMRMSDTQATLTLVNFTDKAQTVLVPHDFKMSRVLVSSNPHAPKRALHKDDMRLMPHESVIIKLR